jgi:uncharacterized protein (TIGR00299 family) protein
MKVLIFDPFCGCAGDMILASMLSAGLEFEKLRAELDRLPLSGFRLEKQDVEKHHIACVKLDVITEDQHAHRHLGDIQEIIDKSGLSEKVRTNARNIFGRLAAAEAKVHNSSPEKIHFHEVGAVDAIVDIVGACIGLELLGIDRIYSRPIGLGRGIIDSAHGKIPVPSPATSELVKDFPVVFHRVEHELSTPTGTAIITTLAEQLNDLAEFNVYSVGYGAGSRDIETLPNFLRIYLAEEMTALERDRILQIQTNIDDLNPEIFSFLYDGLFEMGVKDVFMTPVQMKKNRPGTLLTVICDLNDKDKISRFIFDNSTTSGLRFNLADRVKLKRSIETIDTSYGPVNLKVYFWEGQKRYYPEYEDLKKLAFQHKISIIELNRKLQMEISKIKEI